MSLYLSYFYKSKTSRDGKTGKDFYMKINWSNAADKEVFNLAKATKLTEMRKIHFENIKTDQSKDVLDYFNDNCPEKLRIFCFDASSAFGSGDFYIKGIEKIASVTSKEVYIKFFKLSNSSLEKIIKASCNSDRIVFRTCSLDLASDLDLSGPTYTTNYLSISCNGNCSTTVVEMNKPSGVKRIIKAISLCSLKSSLKTIDIDYCNVTEAMVEEMLKEFKLDHIKVTKEKKASIDE